MSSRGDKAKRSRKDLQAQLDEQLRFLRTSCELWDKGDRSEAKRIAAVVRTLVHDTKNCTPLLRQLGKGQKFWDTAFNVPNDGAQQVWRCRLALPDATRGGTWAPLLDNDDSRKVDFDIWWTETIVINAEGQTFSRKDLILNAAETDGGVHVDPKLDRAYAELTRENSCQMLGEPIDMSNGWPENLAGHKFLQMESPVNASIRQVGHEVLKTLIPWYHYRTAAYTPGVEVVGLVIKPQLDTSVDKKDKSAK